MAKVIGSKFSKKLPKCLPKFLYHFAFLSATNESSITLSALDVLSIPDSGYSNRHVHCNITILISISLRCGESSNILIYFSAICVSSLVRYLFRAFAFLKIELSVSPPLDIHGMEWCWALFPVIDE